MFLHVPSKGGLLRSRAPIALRGKKDTFRGQSVEIVEGDLEFVVSEGVDYVSLAFVEEESAVENLRAELRRRGSDALIIAKMESAQALRNAEAIIRSADAIMIARGDLGTAIAYEKVCTAFKLGVWQKPGGSPVECLRPHSNSNAVSSLCMCVIFVSGAVVAGADCKHVSRQGQASSDLYTLLGLHGDVSYPNPCRNNGYLRSSPTEG